MTSIVNRLNIIFYIYGKYICIYVARVHVVSYFILTLHCLDFIIASLINMQIQLNFIFYEQVGILCQALNCVPTKCNTQYDTGYLK